MRPCHVLCTCTEFCLEIFQFVYSKNTSSCGQESLFYSSLFNLPSPGAVVSMITICEAAHEVVLPPGQAHRLHVVIPERGPCLIAPARLGVKVHVVDIVGV